MPIDYKKYPPNWKTEIRPAVLRRALDCCEFCGVRNKSIIHRYGNGINDWVYYPVGSMAQEMILDGKKATKIVLTVAHLDHDPENHNVSIERLAALCQKCHLRYDSPIKIKNRLKK